MNEANIPPPLPSSYSPVGVVTGDQEELKEADPSTASYVCSALAALSNLLKYAGCTYGKLKNDATYLYKKFQKPLYRNQPGGQAMYQLLKWLVYEDWKDPQFSMTYPISPQDRIKLQEIFKQWQETLSCNESDQKPIPVLPPLKKSVPRGVIVGAVAAVVLIGLGLGFGRGVFDDVLKDDSVNQVVEPILPAGGNSEPGPASEDDPRQDDSASICGNGILEAGESCDGSALGSCTTGCSDQCLCDTPSVCGNNELEAGEECDGRAMGTCVGTCSSGCNCIEDGGSSTGGSSTTWCGDGVCNTNETSTSCAADCPATEGICSENGGVQWQGEVCVCAGFVDQVTVCNDGTKIDNITNAACTPDPASCQPQSGGSDDDGGGGPVCGNGIVEAGETCDGSGDPCSTNTCIQSVCQCLPG